MPTYTVRDPQTGRTVRLTGESPPTEAELVQVFASLGGTDAPQTPQAAPQPSGDAPFGIMDPAIGSLKGAANTVMGLGRLARKVPGVAQLDRIMTPIQVNPPTNTAQRIGFGAEQVGEFFVPATMGVKLAGKAARAYEVAKAGGLTLAQTGSPTAATVSAGLTAAIPGAAAARSLARNLRAGAERNMTQALGATTLAHKATAAELAPQMLARGVKGSRQTMLDEATRRTAAAGAAIGDEIATAATAGTTISGEAIETIIGRSAQSLKVPDASGRLIPMEGAQPVIRRLDRLGKFVVALGPDIPIERAAKIKTFFDRIVSKAGLYGQKVGASATDSADAWAVKEAADAFRALLSESTPTLAALNAEYAFWTGMKGVLKATVKRVQSQGGGLIAGGMGGSGAIVGAISGDSPGDKAEKAFLYGLAGRQLVKTIQSPYWRTAVTAPMKNKLADALAAGSTGQVLHALGRITAAMPARLASATGVPQ